MINIREKIIKELKELPLEKQKDIYNYILSIKKDKNKLSDELSKKLIDGYKYLSKEHIELVDNFGGNDEI